MVENQNTAVIVPEKQELRAEMDNLPTIQLLDFGINGIRLSTEYRYEGSYNEENDRGNDRSNVEIVKHNTFIDGMNRNTEIMQRKKRSNCEENEFSESFPFINHEIITCLIGINSFSLSFMVDEKSMVLWLTKDSQR